MKLAKTDAAKTALRDLLTEDARDAADGNTLVSKSEGKNLDPANRKAELALRQEGGKGTRVRADDVATRAATDAEAVWDRFNVRGPGVLSRREVAQISEAAPELADVTQRAYLRARGLDDPKAAIRTFFETFDFARLDTLPQGRRLDPRVGQPGRADVPAKVLEGFDFYHRAEVADWASAHLYEAKVAGKPVYALITRTDGDRGYLEVYGKDGSPMTSARLYADQLFAHDEFFGRTRISDSMLALDEPRWDEGLSEAPERAAAGQVPLRWPGDVKLDSAVVHHDGQSFTTLELPAGLALDDEQRYVAHAALEMLWDRTLKFRIDRPGEGGLELGPRTHGALTIGEFTRPDDGKTYIAADWRDIDDASFVFYFARTPQGPRWAISQYDN